MNTVQKCGAYYDPGKYLQLWIFILTTCCVTLNTTTAQPSPPVITKDLVAETIPKVGDRYKLRFRAYGQPTPTYIWMKNGKKLKESSENNLEWTSVQLSDAGSYQCIANNSEGAVISKTAQVKVAYIGPFDSDAVSHKIQARIGQSAIVPVPPIKSVPPAEITWLNGTTTMASEGRRYDYTTNQSLVILDIRPEDNGTVFVAEADNSLNPKVKSQSFVIIVTDPDNKVERVEPRIVVPPEDTKVTTNKDNVHFTCIVNARPLNYTITWYRKKEGNRIPLVDTKYILSISKRQLNIKKPEESDNGEYECVVTSPFGSEQRASAILTVQDVPYIKADDLNHQNDFRENVWFHCLGVPPATLHWYFNARPLQSSDRHTIFPNGTLLVKSIDISDAGIYQCIARNEAGEMSIVHQLTVKRSPPEIVGSGLSNNTVLEGGNVRLVSQVKGSPKPVITWARNIGEGLESLKSTGRIQLLQPSVLFLTSTIPEDSGIYKYTAKNNFGEISSEMNLKVLRKTQISQPPQNQSVILGSTVVLKCTVISDPSVGVTWVWYHRKPPVNTPVLVRADERHTIVNGTLKIKGISGMDAGLYTCLVSSSAGNTSRNATIKVMELPFPPIIIQVFAHEDSPGSVSIAWTPGADGNSPIKGYVIQYKEIVPASPATLIKPSWINYPDHISASVNNYTIHGLQPALQYKFRVRAVNNVGEGKPSASAPDKPLLIPQQPPSGPPTNLVGRSRSNSSIILQWLMPEKQYRNGPLLGYNIRYSLQGYANLSYGDTVDDPNLTRHTITGLVPFTSYNIKIAARNAKGVGVFSPSITVWTEEGRPTAPPTNIVCTAVNSTVIKVRWLAPDSTQIFGLLKGYYITAHPVEKEKNYKTITEKVDVDIKNMYGIQQGYVYGLQKYTVYRVSVTSFTHKGNGPESVSKTIRTLEDVPDEVSSLAFNEVTDRSLIVVWTPPIKTNGILIGYELSYGKKNSSDLKIFNNLTAIDLTCRVENLLPTTLYTISVAAKTSVGVGPKRSADIKSGSTPVLPTKPSNLGISNIETDSVQLQFTPGFNGKTSITRWIVEAQIEEDTNWVEIFAIKAPDATYLTISPLIPYTHYTLRIIAENIVGQSQPSVPSRMFQTKQAPPAKPPGNLTVWAVNETALRISWTLLTKRDWNGEPRGYDIFYRMKSPDTEWIIIQLANAVNNYSYILTGLNEWVEYEVKMQSYNSVGKSPFSPTLVQKTIESVPSSGPSNVTGEAVSSTTIKIRWGDVPVFEQNGFILGFKVTYKAQGSSQEPRYRTVGNDTRSVTLKHLLKYVVYEIQVLAFTKMGDGVPSNPVLSIRTLEDVPDPPIIIYFPMVTYQMARVVWAPPTKPNGIIIRYRVSYILRDDPDNKESSYTEVSSDVHEYTASGLARETYYNFSVSAKTNVGWGKPAIVEVFTMKDRSPPESPSEPVILSQVQARSVSISWQNGNDGYGPLRNFTIQFQQVEKEEDNEWQTVPDVVPPSVTTFTVTGLKPNSTYRFRVAATNDIGTSPFSNSSQDVSTLQDEPEKAPTNLKVVSITTDSVNITWQVPPAKSWNGPLLGFRIQYRQDDLTDFQQEDVPYKSKRTLLWTEISNLKKFVNYEFRVIAYNVIGESPASKPFIYFVGYAPPSAAPVNVIAEALNGSRVKVTWDPPPQISQNGKISGYKVVYYRLNRPEKKKGRTSLNNEVILDHLSMYSKYSISVQAFNTAGQGPMAKEVLVQTKQGAPGAPANLTFFSIMLRSLNVSWTQPSKPNGIIRFYEVTYYQEFTDDGRKMVQLNVPGNQLFYHAKELEENKTYVFTVRAKTIQLGRKVTGSIRTGPQKGSPESPSKPICEMTPRGVNISWANQGEGSYPITKYLLQARKEDPSKSEEAYRTKRDNGAGTSGKGKGIWVTILLKESPQIGALLNVHSLDAGSIYQFRVIAINWLGISFPSEPSEPLRIEDPTADSQVDGKRHFISRPFHTEWWFLVIIALSGLIVIMTVILLLVLVGRKRRIKRESMRKRNTPPLPLEPPPVDDGGFTTFDRRQSRRNLSLRTGSLRSMRSPPRPSPASVTYSDDEGDAKPPIDDNSSSLTEKPDIEELTEPSDDESEMESTKNPSGSTAAGTFYNQYVNDTVRESWQQSNPKSMYGAYNYTDSEEADSSTYNMSLNGGYMMVNNRAGSRTPVAGFSSFV